MEFKHNPQRTARFDAITNTIHAQGDWIDPVVCHVPDGPGAVPMNNDGQSSDLDPNDYEWACSALILVDGVYWVCDEFGCVKVEVRR